MLIPNKGRFFFASVVSEAVLVPQYHERLFQLYPGFLIV